MKRRVIFRCVSPEGFSNITVCPCDQNVLACVLRNKNLFIAAIDRRWIFHGNAGTQSFMQFPCAAFHNAVRLYHACNRTEKTFCVHEKSLFPHIFTVQFRFLHNFQLIPPVNLRQTCQSGQNIICPVFLPLRNQIILIPQRGTRTDHAHFSPENIPNLGKFIQTGLAQYLSNSCYVLFGISHLVCRDIVRRGHLHGTELMQQEKMFIFSCSLLCEENRTWIVNFNRKTDDSIQW